MDERKPHFVGKTLAAGRNGLWIPVDREHRPSLPKAWRFVPYDRRAKRRIDIVTARFEGQTRERLGNEHWCVLIHFAWSRVSYPTPARPGEQP